MTDKIVGNYIISYKLEYPFKKDIEWQYFHFNLLPWVYFSYTCRNKPIIKDTQYWNSIFTIHFSLFIVTGEIEIKK